VELNVVKQGKSLAQVSFTVPGDEFAKEVHRGLLQARERVRMKGFRPGKAPLSVVEKAYGEQVRYEVKQFFVRKAYQRAVEEQSLRPLAHPRLDTDELRAAPAEQAGFALEFEISLRPEIELGAYKGLTVESELEAVMDQEVQDALAEIRRQQSRPEPAGEDGIEEQGLFLCTVEFLIDGVSCFRRENLRLSPVTTPPGVDPEHFHDAVLGKKKGETVEIATKIPPYVEDVEARGKDGVCRVEIGDVYRMIPPEDAQLYAALGVSTESELLDKVREKLGEAKEQRENSRVEASLVDKLIKDTAIDLPEPLIEEQANARVEKLRQRLEQEGLPPDKIEEAVNEQGGTAREEAEKALKALLIIESIGEKESLLVSKTDIDEEIGVIAARNNATPEEVRQYYSKSEMGQQLVVEILERKVRRFLRENAKIQVPS
jgi:trigger factor